jgi:hypothetical protein
MSKGYGGAFANSELATKSHRHEFERNYGCRFVNHNPVTYEITGSNEIAPPQKKSETDDVAGISREKMDERKNTTHREAKSKSNKTDIHIRSECHQEKAGNQQIWRESEGPTTQDPQHGPGIFEPKKTSNERMPQTTCEESRESKCTR